jgi:hypothetical protein
MDWALGRKGKEREKKKKRRKKERKTIPCIAYLLAFEGAASGVDQLVFYKKHCAKIPQLAFLETCFIRSRYTPSGEMAVDTTQTSLTGSHSMEFIPIFTISDT